MRTEQRLLWFAMTILMLGLAKTATAAPVYLRCSIDMKFMNAMGWQDDSYSKRFGTPSKFVLPIFQSMEIELDAEKKTLYLVASDTKLPVVWTYEDEYIAVGPYDARYFLRVAIDRRSLTMRQNLMDPKPNEPGTYLGDYSPSQYQCEIATRPKARI